MKMFKLPKFHDKLSLIIGILMGILLIVNGIYDIVLLGCRNIIGNVIQVGIGSGLVLHCLDMIDYYKSHRIIKKKDM